MVTIGSKWVRRHHAEVYMVRMIEGGQIYMVKLGVRGTTCSIPVENIGLEFAPASIELPTVTIPPELLPLALEIQEARVRAEAEGSLRQRMVNVRTDVRSMEERRVR